MEVIEFPTAVRVPNTFTEHEHEVIKALGNTMIAKDVMAYWQYGETEEGDEWYVMVDHFGAERIVFNKAENGKCHCLRNMDTSPAYNDIEQYIEDMWGTGWTEVSNELHSQHTATILEFHELVKQA